MTEISDGAAAISTYGLYAIVSALAVCTIYLFKALRDLESKFRSYITTTAEQLLEKTNTALIDSTNALKASNEIMNRLATIIDRKGG